MSNTKQIRDAIYGFIELDKQEIAIISDPSFQRLRRIKQLAFTDMVYPGACHTRFEHSLGVMQMATDMYEHIFSSHADKIKNYLKIESEYFTREKEYLRKIVRLAALLHDVGHAPFSHAGEDLMPVNPESGKHYKHEHYSVCAIKTIFKKYIEDAELSNRFSIKDTDITAMLDDNESVLYGDARHLFLRQIISSQIDADRADYLLRDSVHLGVSYGYYDRHRFISCLSIGNIESEDDGCESGLTLAIDKKGINVAESLVIARYQMFNQVYFHKVRRIYDYHLASALAEVLPEVGCIDGIFPDPASIGEYMKLDDWVIQGAILKNGSGKHCKIIRERRHYKASYTTSDPPTVEDEEKVKKLQELDPNGYLDDNAKTSWYKHSNEIWITDGIKIESIRKSSKLVESLLAEPTRQVFYSSRED